MSFAWSEAASGSATWDRDGSDWNNKVTVNSNTSMTLRPRVVETSPSWSGTVTWTVTLRDTTGATALKSFTVTYTPPTPYTLTVTTQGQGSVTLSPSGGSYASGTQGTLTATPASGWQFSGWSGDLTGSQNPASITMTSNKNVTASFSQVATAPQITGVSPAQPKVQAAS